MTSHSMIGLVDSDPDGPDSNEPIVGFVDGLEGFQMGDVDGSRAV